MRIVSTGTPDRHLRRTTASLAVSGALAVGLVGLLPAASAMAAPIGIDLYAVTGSTTLPGAAAPTPVWGYRTTAGNVSAPGGPTLTVDEGDVVTVTLHNALGGPATSLLVQGHRAVTGQDAGGNATYTFTAGKPGTFLYEAAPFGNREYQTAMGLHGALVVRPADHPVDANGDPVTTAYDGGTDTAYDEDAVLVLSELDPALNTAATKTAFDMRGFDPKYFLVNGKAYPDTDPIATQGGHTVLLRYVNAGVTYHSMGVLGSRQTVVGTDGNKLDFSRSYVAQTFGPGETADALVSVPAAAPQATSLTVYDASGSLRNSTQGAALAAPALGGMVTTVDIAPVAATGDTVGPVSSQVTFDGTTLSAHVDDSQRGNSSIDSVEYYVDSLAPAAAQQLSGAVGATADVDTTGVPGVATGEHVIYVRATDHAGNAGPFTSVLVTGADAGAPTTSAVLVTPRLANHGPVVGGADQGVAVTVTATGDDSASGGSNVTDAEFFLDAPGTDGSGTHMTPNLAAPVVALTGTLVAADEKGLTEGAHPVFVHSMDAGGAWEALDPANPAGSLVIDLTGPESTGLTIAPSATTNGTQGIAAGTNVIRLTAASLSDQISNGVNSAISAAEARVDGGAAIQMVALDGSFSDTTEGAYVDIPLSTVRQLSSGAHTLTVRAKDAAGNWGPLASTTLTVDRTAPVASASFAGSSPTQGARTATLNVTGTDASGVVRAEYFVGATDPGQGNATAMTAGAGDTFSADIDTSTLAEGSYTVRARVLDAAGNWSAVVSTTLTVTAPLWYSTVGSSNPPGVGGTADDSDIYRWSGNDHSRSIDLSAAPYRVPTSANVDGYSRVDGTHFYLSFTGSVNLPGLGTVQDEDVVSWNNGSWSMFFDGSAHGLGGNGSGDIDAIDVEGGVLYFSTLGNQNPSGVNGSADDADLYRWTGTAMSRFWDASANGLPGGANTDGAVVLDATHLYLSFSPTTTTVPVLGGVQDEDVVAFNAGTWSVYFNGTAHGLTSNNLDVDAFDLP